LPPNEKAPAIAEGLVPDIGELTNRF